MTAPQDDCLSDYGLVQLSNCPNLTSIILNGRDKQGRGGLSWKSVALLLMNLTRLGVLVCEPKIKKEAMELLVCRCQVGNKDVGQKCPCHRNLEKDILAELSLSVCSLLSL